MEENAAKLMEVCEENGADLLVLDAVCSSPTQSGPATQMVHRSSSSHLSETGALIIYTSGTTGKPKGALHSHRYSMLFISSLRGYEFGTVINMQEHTSPSKWIGRFLEVEWVGCDIPSASTPSHPWYCKCFILPSICGSTSQFHVKI
jgi:acyl-CoA synthetase (AMP-forming)/AMP-acid ligase II